MNEWVAKRAQNTSDNTFSWLTPSTTVTPSSYVSATQFQRRGLNQPESIRLPLSICVLFRVFISRISFFSLSFNVVSGFPKKLYFRQRSWRDRAAHKDRVSRAPVAGGIQAQWLLQAAPSCNISTEQLLRTIRRLVWMKTKDLLYDVFFYRDYLRHDFCLRSQDKL